jgi:hypothetical protein
MTSLILLELKGNELSCKKYIIIDYTLNVAPAIRKP